jgi:hypothetical protein
LDARTLALERAAGFLPLDEKPRSPNVETSPWFEDEAFLSTLPLLGLDGPADTTTSSSSSISVLVRSGEKQQDDISVKVEDAQFGTCKLS